MVSKKQMNLFGWPLVIVIAYFAYTYYEYRQYDSFEAATVYDTSESVTKTKIRYKFFVDGSEIRGYDQTRLHRRVSTGDQFLVVYSSRNPEQHRVSYEHPIADSMQLDSFRVLISPRDVISYTGF